MEPLSPAACRVLGCLIEKETTVPDTYPMTLNALCTACNQRSSRDPVVDYGESEVVAAADELRGRGLTRLVHQPGGRASKYKHTADEALTLDDPSLAVLSVLLLRGAQTVGELRTRSERQFAFTSLDEVAHTLDRLASRDEPLVRLLERQPGHKEARWVELMSGEPAPSTPTPASPEPVSAPAAMAVAADESDLDEIRDRVARLEERFEELLSRLGEDLSDG